MFLAWKVCVCVCRITEELQSGAQDVIKQKELLFGFISSRVVSIHRKGTHTQTQKKT